MADDLLADGRELETTIVDAEMQAEMQAVAAAAQEREDATTQDLHQELSDRAQHAVVQAGRAVDAHAKAERPNLPQPFNDFHEIGQMDKAEIVRYGEVKLGQQGMKKLMDAVGAERAEDVPAAVRQQGGRSKHQISR